MRKLHMISCEPSNRYALFFCYDIFNFRSSNNSILQVLFECTALKAVNSFLVIFRVEHEQSGFTKNKLLIASIVC